MKSGSAWLDREPAGLDVMVRAIESRDRVLDAEAKDARCRVL